MPGRRSTIRYWPVSSLTTERTFSIRTGLAASTVTPGSTAPDASLTTPAMAPCANAAAGTSRTTSRTAADRRASAHITFLLKGGVVAKGVRNGAVSHECGASINAVVEADLQVRPARIREEDGYPRSWLTRLY